MYFLQKTKHFSQPPILGGCRTRNARPYEWCGKSEFDKPRAEPEYFNPSPQGIPTTFHFPLSTFHSTEGSDKSDFDGLGSSSLPEGEDPPGIGKVWGGKGLRGFGQILVFHGIVAAILKNHRMTKW